MTDVVLVQMPFAGVERPSIALGLLSALLKEEGIPVRSHYPNIAFADRIGLDAYRLIEQAPLTNLIGEWLFAEAAFGPRGDVDAQERHLAVCAADLEPRLLEEALKYRGFISGEDLLDEIRAATHSFVRDQAVVIVNQGARVVGCTSLFQQHTASLALLRAVKRLAPEVITVLGGGNCAGLMGAATHRAFDWVDFTATGDVDDHAAEFFATLLDGSYASHDGRLPPNVLGPADRFSGAGARGLTLTMTTDLDRLPPPDYDDYFDALTGFQAGRYILPSIQFESSRGCWWGTKHHCTFCGLNANGMAYRSKSAMRIRDEIDHLVARHKTARLSAVDNIIHPSYFRSLLPELATDGRKYEIFYETKANLTRIQVEVLARSGVRWIQPGIESLHDETLRLIRKGTTAVINISLLKHCLELGVQPTWNMLVGVPGEQAEWLASIRGLLPRLFHLPPPQGVGPIRYDRFSPYFEDADEFGLVLEPFASYAVIYPLDRRDLRDIAYYFEDIRDPAARGQTERWAAEIHRLSETVSQWQRSFLGGHPPVLTIAEDRAELWIRDTRPSATEREHRLSGVVADIYRLLQQPTSPNRILERVESTGAGGLTRDQLQRVLEGFDQSGLIWQTDNRVVALACRATDAEMPSSRDVPPWGTVNLGALFMDRQHFLAWKRPAGVW